MLRNWNFEMQLDSQSDKAIYLQIADAIIKDIQSGRLKAGDALPGSRNLAQLLTVHRNTVVEALNVLMIEGWLVSKERKGTFVADTLPDFEAITKTSSIPDVMGASGQYFHFGFDDGNPDIKLAPIKELARAYRQIFNQKARWQMLGYSSELGNLDFRRSIVQMLNHQRGLHINEHRICITRGSQMAMYLAAQCFLEKGDCVMIENPGYKPAWSVFEHAGATLLPLRVDKDGLCMDDVLFNLKSHQRIKAIYVTPHHQYPTTATLSLGRRLELIKLSNEYGFTIIEDDYDHEFHFGYRPLLPLSSYAELNNYIYIGTMSKVVAPALRIGYLASNDRLLIEKVGALRKMIDVQGDSIMEQAVLQLIQDGTIKRHIKKATGHYKVKRNLMADLLRKYMTGKATYTIPEGGLAFWIVPDKLVNWTQFVQNLEDKHINIMTPDKYSFGETVSGIRLGYGSLTEKELEAGIMALSKIF